MRMVKAMDAGAVMAQCKVKLKKQIQQEVCMISWQKQGRRSC